MRRKPPLFSKKEIVPLVERFIDHFGKLEEIRNELVGIQSELAKTREMLEDRLTFLAVALGGTTR